MELSALEDMLFDMLNFMRWSGRNSMVDFKDVAQKKKRKEIGKYTNVQNEGWQ